MDNIGFIQPQPERERFMEEALSGLKKPQKELPSKYFYDKQGSYLFERICSLEEYYIPDVERAVMQANIREIAGLVGPGAFIVEYGSGDCKKIRFLLDNLETPAAYVPIDISQEQLGNVAEELAADYPDLELLPVCADFTGIFEIPETGRKSNRTVAYFPGSTIGNFGPEAAKQFLERIARVCGKGGALLIGIDLKKDAAVLNRAYNDKDGVTAEFNLNLLHRVNRELGSDFQPALFEHSAFYNPDRGRIEMHLISLEDQVVRLNGHNIDFKKGETIWTESSYKYNLEEFEELAGTAGFSVRRAWTDDKRWFAVLYLEVV